MFSTKNITVLARGSPAVLEFIKCIVIMFAWFGAEVAEVFNIWGSISSLSFKIILFYFSNQHINKTKPAISAPFIGSITTTAFYQINYTRIHKAVQSIFVLSNISLILSSSSSHFAGLGISFTTFFQYLHLSTLGHGGQFLPATV